ncbi:uncharacterized protein LOC132943204 isoform X1 [Metopolophium dirhodum]|uniref:uncharacterized protein LOC132943204 isoform X1 n=1 Tax=Metopolophium dirhodum TaxID=44670 RepID=UPI00299011F1|nr:uncharacterized protein LOC132943204 isoform X1 [Metopolophium dirhodum]
MDDENGSSSVFNIFLTSMVHIIQKCFNVLISGHQHYNISNKFNTSCTKETQCENTAMFCDLTTLRCQCAVFHFWNETVGICQYKHEHLTKWLDSNRTNNINFITEIVQDPQVSRYTIPLPVIAVMILGGLCFLFCAAYVCYGKDEVDGDKKSLSAALCKQKEQSCRIQTSIMENF